ncbi:MAG: DUF4105 domain-containing protein [Curvibacter sp.]
MTRAFAWTSFLFLLHLSHSGHAQLIPGVEQLAREPTWQRLLHYEADGSSPSGLRSAIHSPEFFLDTAGGMTSPEAELRATLQAMRAETGADPDRHAQCRFPARRQWLADRLGAAAGWRQLRCPKYEEWTRSSSVESISIVLATGYLGNPASFYGHTLLKFNSRRDGVQTALEDVSVNFGAIVTDNDDPVTYLAKSLTGGYEAGFSHIKYYFHNHNYGENELRDLWEYRLDLEPTEVERVVAHAWEVLGQRYNYYFFIRNCAFRMAEVVQVVDGVDFIPRNRPYVIPQALVQTMGEARNPRGRALVAETIYHPSRQSRFYARYENLDKSSADFFRRAAMHPELVESQEFNTYSLGARQAILDTLIDYYQFTADGQARAQGKVHPGYARALAKRYSLPPGQQQLTGSAPPSPHLARPPSWLQAGWQHSQVTGNALLVKIRPAHYDALDGVSGQVAYSSLTMAETHLELRSDGLKLRRFDLLAVENIAVGLTGLPGDRGSAWKTRVGVERVRLDCADCMVARMQGDLGTARKVSPGLVAAAYVGGALQNNRIGQGPGFIRASAELIYRSEHKLAMKLGHERRRPIGSDVQPYGVSSAEIRYAIDARSDLRLRHDRDVTSATSFSYGLYW